MQRNPNRKILKKFKLLMKRLSPNQLKKLLKMRKKMRKRILLSHKTTSSTILMVLRLKRIKLIKENQLTIFPGIQRRIFQGAVQGVIIFLFRCLGKIMEILTLSLNSPMLEALSLKLRIKFMKWTESKKPRNSKNVYAVYSKATIVLSANETASIQVALR